MQKIYVEIIDQIIELVIDPFGNYFIQKLLEVCIEEQKMQILLAITRKASKLVLLTCMGCALYKNFKDARTSFSSYIST